MFSDTVNQLLQNSNRKNIKSILEEYFWSRTNYSSDFIMISLHDSKFLWLILWRSWEVKWIFLAVSLIEKKSLAKDIWPWYSLLSIRKCPRFVEYWSFKLGRLYFVLYWARRANMSEMFSVKVRRAISSSLHTWDLTLYPIWQYSKKMWVMKKESRDSIRYNRLFANQKYEEIKNYQKSSGQIGHFFGLVRIFKYVIDFVGQAR